MHLLIGGGGGGGFNPKKTKQKPVVHQISFLGLRFFVVVGFYWTFLRKLFNKF